MRYNKIRKMDIANGPGIRVSIFLQGCEFNCKDCFNPETHDFNGGKEFSKDTMKTLMNLCEDDNIVGLSIIGGEPLHPKNIEGTTKIAKEFKEKYHNKNLWIWTGYNYEDLEHEEILNYVDVIVDGRFQADKKNPKLNWKGSENQRVIDVPKTLKQKKIVFYTNTQDE